MDMTLPVGARLRLLKEEARAPMGTGGDILRRPEGGKRSVVVKPTGSQRPGTTRGRAAGPDAGALHRSALAAVKVAPDGVTALTFTFGNRDISFPVRGKRVGRPK